MTIDNFIVQYHQPNNIFDENSLRYKTVTS